MTAAHGDMSKRDFELLHHTRRSLATCQDSLAKRGMFERGIERRQALAERARRSLGLDLSMFSHCLLRYISTDSTF